MKKDIGLFDRKIRDNEIKSFFYKADGQTSRRLFDVLEEVYEEFYKKIFYKASKNLSNIKYINLIKIERKLVLFV